jgi:atypical dual specificity phosphatase|tara:strand:- start:1952 stop:2452 length:501 start_codon:yes stop_codon:yes gene_type:complete
MFIGDIYRKIYGSLFSKPTNFNWVIEKQIAASGIPQSKKDVDFIVAQGISSILVLTTTFPNAFLNNSSLKIKHLSLIDHSIPSIDKIIEALDFIQTSIDSNSAILIHCRAGKGRTGTILASYFVNSGWDVQTSIKHIRKLRSGSIEKKQILALENFKDYLEKKPNS